MLSDIKAAIELLKKAHNQCFDFDSDGDSYCVDRKREQKLRGVIQKLEAML